MRMVLGFYVHLITLFLYTVVVLEDDDGQLSNTEIFLTFHVTVSTPCCGLRCSCRLCRCCSCMMETPFFVTQLLLLRCHQQPRKQVDSLPLNQRRVSRRFDLVLKTRSSGTICFGLTSWHFSPPIGSRSCLRRVLSFPHIPGLRSRMRHQWLPCGNNTQRNAHPFS